MLGKIVEIYSEYVNVASVDPTSRIRIGDFVHCSSRNVIGTIISIERNNFQIKVSVGLETLKIGDIIELDSGLNEIKINLFGNTWGENNSNLKLLDYKFSTINLELTGNPKLDFIPVVRVGETVSKNQKLGYFELSKKLKYWILTPDYQNLYIVKKINSGFFGEDDIVSTLDFEDKKYEIKTSQQFHFDGTIESEIANLEQDILNENFDEYNFVIVVSTFLDERVNFEELKFVSFLTSYNDNWNYILQKAYNLSLYLTYCGNKVLFVNNLKFKETGSVNFEFGTITNFEGEKGTLDCVTTLEPV